MINLFDIMMIGYYRLLSVAISWPVNYSFYNLMGGIFIYSLAHLHYWVLGWYYRIRIIIGPFN